MPVPRSLRWLLAVMLAAVTVHVQALTFTPGDIYTSSVFSTTITHVRAGSGSLETYTLDLRWGSEVKGLAFGQDGLLYAVTARGNNFGVVAIDGSGAVVASYDGSGYVAGNLSSGQIAFGANGAFYVAGPNGLSMFNVGSPTGSIINDTNALFDVALLPSGDLLALGNYGLQELTSTGGLVRDIVTSTRLIDARGVAFDRATGDIFVTVLSNGPDMQLLRFDGSTGQLQKHVGFSYGNDIAQLSNGTLLVGSRVQAPGIFDLDLNRIGTLAIGQQMFVTQMPIPEPGTTTLTIVGMIALGYQTRRRASMPARTSVSR